MLASFALTFSKQSITAFVNIPCTVKRVLNYYRIETYKYALYLILQTISVIRVCSSRYHDFTRPESVG